MCVCVCAFCLPSDTESDKKEKFKFIQETAKSTMEKLIEKANIIFHFYFHTTTVNKWKILLWKTMCIKIIQNLSTKFQIQNATITSNVIYEGRISKIFSLRFFLSRSQTSMKHDRFLFFFLHLIWLANHYCFIVCHTSTFNISHYTHTQKHIDVKLLEISSANFLI